MRSDADARRKTRTQCFLRFLKISEDISELLSDTLCPSGGGLFSLRASRRGRLGLATWARGLGDLATWRLRFFVAGSLVSVLPSSGLDDPKVQYCRQFLVWMAVK